MATIRGMTPISTIEQIWQELRTGGEGSRQRRVDATHPLDLYIDFEPPDRPGLVAVCGSRPPACRPLRALTVEHGQRTDGRWSLRLSLHEQRLLPVFAALCRDIVAFTRSGVDERRLAATVLGRLDHWRSLLERDAAGLGEAALRGLIGELLVLEKEVLAALPLREAVGAWTGPRGSPQDFLLPTGTRIEVKTIGRDAGTVRVNGLGQLDAGADPLVLAVVRVEATGASAYHALTVPMLVTRLRDRISADPDALADFEATLACAGWHEDPLHDAFAVRLIAIEAHEIGPAFPRLTARSVPPGIEDADYTIVLPQGARTVIRSET
jgi:Putative  PD-(D/E)XK family member, (DUF4420)